MRRAGKVIVAVLLLLVGFTAGWLAATQHDAAYVVAARDCQ